MRRTAFLFRLTAGVALTALLCDLVVPLPAVAQPAPPTASQPGQNQGDPPERVGRIAVITGTVSFHNPGDTDWSAATINYPVTSGNSFWTEPSAVSVLEISDSRVALAGATELTVSMLDRSGLQATLSQGETYLHLRDLAPNETWSIQTPRGMVRINAAGRYDIVSGTTDQPTLVTVLDGSAQIDAPGVSLTVNANQTATISGSDPFQGGVGPVIRTAFLTSRLDAERPRPAPGVAVPQQVVAMAGGGDLVETGSWTETPEYGRVWYPPVQNNWVPYREGHWAYVAPWGWTWIDNASWGFAPFHYGRWVHIGPHWAWTPGVVHEQVYERPVYAPALVTFIGIAAGAAVGAALASGSVGWIPLGPREPFIPWYHASPTYVRQINVSHVTNVTNITTVNNITVNNYVNRAAATSVPATVMTESRPVQAVARPIPPQAFAAARPIVGRQPIGPAAITLGVTPVVARQLHLAPAPVVHAAPGPVVRVQAPATPGRPEARPPLPTSNGAARPAGAPAAAAAQPNRPVESTRPGEAVPPAVANRPGQPAQPGQPVPPAAANRPGEQVRPVEPVPPATANRSGEPVPSAAANHPGQPVRTGEPVPAAAANRPGERVRPVEPNRAGTPPTSAQPPLPTAHSANEPALRPGAPATLTRPAEAPARPEARPMPSPAHLAEPTARPAPQPSAAHPTPEPAARPASEPRPAPVARPTPEAKPIPQPRPAADVRPAPAPRPVAEPRAVAETRPTAPAPHPVPEARPAPAARPSPPAPAHPANERKPGEP